MNIYYSVATVSVKLWWFHQKNGESEYINSYTFFFCLVWVFCLFVWVCFFYYYFCWLFLHIRLPKYPFLLLVIQSFDLVLLNCTYNMLTLFMLEWVIAIVCLVCCNKNTLIPMLSIECLNMQLFSQLIVASEWKKI